MTQEAATTVGTELGFENCHIPHRYTCLVRRSPYGAARHEYPERSPPPGTLSIGYVWSHGHKVPGLNIGPARHRLTDPCVGPAAATIRRSRFPDLTPVCRFAVLERFGPAPASTDTVDPIAVVQRVLPRRGRCALQPRTNFQIFRSRSAQYGSRNSRLSVLPAALRGKSAMIATCETRW